jgi:MraZ protein
MRAFLRVAVASAKDCPVDRAGRTLVPPELRDFAALAKDVMIVGALSKFEIWNRERWNDQYQRARVAYDENARKLSDFGL